MSVNPIPEGFRTVTPYMVIRGAAEAIEYYQQAFGAEVIDQSMTPDGGFVMNAHLKIGDSVIMISDEMPMMEYWVSPKNLNGTTVGIHLFVDDVDTWFERAKSAGVKVLMEPGDMFWGDRYCQFIDKFGHAWSIGTRKENLTAEESNERAAEWFAQMAQAGGQ
jgi:PhnB protein